MSNRQLEEAYERKSDEHVARELGISVETLNDHDYEVEEANHGIVWRINWQGAAPPGVKTYGSIGGQYSDIAPLNEPDEPEDPEG
ncbi:hypothetical protein [Reyranella sp.]|uniref:hypothetical protein n=1 Tax=Reyranella sp. TaxID=1929291 RepID=UPI003D0FF589